MAEAEKRYRLLLERAETLHADLIAWAAEDCEGSGVAGWAAREMGGVVIQITKGWVDAQKLAATAQAKANRDAQWQAEQKSRQEKRDYEEMDHLIAERLGLSLEEAHQRRMEAAERTRRAASLGDIATQTAKVPHG